MDTILSKTAHDLATLAIERKHMPKQAELSPTVRSALTGALIGGVGTGLISSLYGRPGKSVTLDALLGAGVGGATGAAVPFISDTAKSLQHSFTEPDVSWLQYFNNRLKGVGAPELGTGTIVGLGHHALTNKVDPVLQNPQEERKLKAAKREAKAKDRGKVYKPKEYNVYQKGLQAQEQKLYRSQVRSNRARGIGRKAKSGVYGILGALLMSAIRDTYKGK